MVFGNKTSIKLISKFEVIVNRIIKIPLIKGPTYGIIFKSAPIREIISAF